MFQMEIHQEQRNGEYCQELQGNEIFRLPRPMAKSAQKRNGGTEGFRAEEDPAQAYEMEYSDPLNPRPSELMSGKLLKKSCSAKIAFDRHGRAVEPAPNYKSPIRSMPEPTEQHGCEQIAVSLVTGLGATAQWNVEIIAQPSAEADMPSAP